MNSSKKKLKLPSEILKSRPELNETRIGLLKGAIGIIPNIGTMINEILFDIPNRIYQSRINSMVNILDQKISVLDSSTIKKDYIESEDFFDFTRQLFESCLKIKSEEKRIALANIYVDSFICNADYEKSKYRLFMNFIVRLSPVEINLLKFIELNKQQLLEIGTYPNFYTIYSNSPLTVQLEKYEFKHYCNDLDFKALISMGSGLEAFEATSQNVVVGDHKEPSVKITTLGKEFINFLTEK